MPPGTHRRDERSRRRAVEGNVSSLCSEEARSSYLRCSLCSADWIEAAYASAVYVAPDTP